MLAFIDETINIEKYIDLLQSNLPESAFEPRGLLFSMKQWSKTMITVLLVTIQCSRTTFYTLASTQGTYEKSLQFIRLGDNDKKNNF